MRISTISTFTDWTMLHGTGGLVGIARIMDWLKVARIDTVYWRAFNGGTAVFPSKIASVQVGRDSPLAKVGDGGGPLSSKYYALLDFRGFDPLAEAVRLGHDRGIKVHAWFTCNEEDHGGPHLSAFGQQKQFRKHDRQGRDFPGTVDCFYPEVQAYKLSLLDELLSRGVDGVLLDYVRSNATPSGDGNGVHRFGYNPEIREAFKRHHGADPLDCASDDKNWLAFKQRYQSAFIATIKKHLGANRALSVLVIPHVDNRRWMCLDLPTLTKSKTIQHVMTSSMTYDPSPKRVAQEFKTIRAQVHRNATIAMGVQAYNGIDPEVFDACVVAASDAGATQVVLHEADALIGQELLTCVRGVHLGAPRHSRDVEVKSISKRPFDSDWKRAKLHSGFFVVLGADREKPTASTAFSVLRTASALHVRVIAHGEQGEPNQSFVTAKKVFIDWLGSRMYWLMADRAHVFVDVGAGRRDFAHCMIGRNGDRRQGKRSDGSWSPRWRGEVRQVSNRRWEATFEIPFAALGRRPKRGERWGFQIVREQAATREASGWFVSTGRIVSPRHWGDLIFS